MSPTLLEFVIAIVVIITAWQLGLALAPMAMQWWRQTQRDLEQMTDESLDEPKSPITGTSVSTKETRHDS